MKDTLLQYMGVLAAADYLQKEITNTLDRMPQNPDRVLELGNGFLVMKNKCDVSWASEDHDWLYQVKVIKVWLEEATPPLFLRRLYQLLSVPPNGALTLRTGVTLRLSKGFVDELHILFGEGAVNVLCKTV